MELIQCRILSKENIEARRIWRPALAAAFGAGSPRAAAAPAQAGSLALVSYLFVLLSP